MFWQCSKVWIVFVFCSAVSVCCQVQCAHVITDHCTLGNIEGDWCLKPYKNSDFQNCSSHQSSPWCTVSVVTSVTTGSCPGHSSDPACPPLSFSSSDSPAAPHSAVCQHPSAVSELLFLQSLL